MNADKFLTQRIMLIGNDLNSTENRMASFKQTNDVIDFDKNASIYLDQSNQANQQVMKLESETWVFSCATIFASKTTATTK